MNILLGIEMDHYGLIRYLNANYNTYLISKILNFQKQNLKKYSVKLLY